MPVLKAKLIEEAKRIEEDSLYSAKKHFIAATSWSKRNYWLGIPTTILAAAASAAAFSRFDKSSTVAGLIGIAVAVLSALSTFLKPNERAASHLDAGNKYQSLKNRARLFHEVTCVRNLADDELAQQLDALVIQRDELNQSSPLTPPRVFEAARKAIEAGEAQYLVDEKKARRHSAE